MTELINNSNEAENLFDGKKSKDFYDNFIGLDEEATIGIIDYIPKYFLQREPSFTKHFVSPTVVIILDNKKKCKSLIYQKGLFRFVKDNHSVRYGSLPKEFDKMVLDLLNHYNQANFFDIAQENTKKLSVSKSVACVFFGKRRYLIPLNYRGKDTNLQGCVAEIRKNVEMIFDEMIFIIGQKAESYYHNKDIDNLFSRYKKRYNKYQEKENVKWNELMSLIHKD